MIVRQIDPVTGDWTFGQGRNNYVAGNAAVAQLIATRLTMFVNDCFFDRAAGLDWLSLLSQKDTTALQLATAAVILNTDGVTQLSTLSVVYAATSRSLTLSYQVQTVYSTTVTSNVNFTV